MFDKIVKNDTCGEFMWFKAFIALVVLLKIGIFLYFVEYGQFVENDSVHYLKLAKNLARHHVFSMSSAAPFEPQVIKSPGYPAFLAILSLMGMKGPYWIVFWQELLYGLCIFLFFFYGKRLFDRNIVIAGVIFLLLEPAGWVYPKLILSEVLFLPFLFLGMFAIGLYLRESRWQNLAVAGFLFGLGAFIRAGILYLPMVIAITLCCFDYRNLKRWLHVGLFLLIFISSLSPWLIRNYMHFDKLFFSGAKGNIMLKYFVPKVWDAAGVVPREQGKVLIQKREDDAIAELSNQIGRLLSPVERIQLKQKMAVAELAKYPLVLIEQWVLGSIKTMIDPFVTQLYDSYGIQSHKASFYTSMRKTNGFFEGIWLFLINMDFIFFINFIATIIMAGFALLGSFNIISQKNCFLWVMMLANFYFIYIAGPEGYARFRFPVGLFWFIQAYLGFRWVIAMTQRNKIT
jgi:4-amino-4-deoxy-L-arabinose transferase-like glycosyltransferase